MRVRPTAFPADRFVQLGIDRAWSRTTEVMIPGEGTVTVHALDAAPPGGEAQLTVVCLHGNPTWSILWRSFHRRLADRYRVLAVDQLSMGLSDRVGPRRFAQRVDDLGQILDAFAVEGPVVLAAHDWGGPIALGWAVANQERVRGVILANTAVSLTAGGVPPLIELAGSRSLRDVVCRRTTAFIQATLRSPGRGVPSDVRHAYLAPYASPRDRAAIEHFVADIPTTATHPSFAAVARVADRLTELDVPVLLAWGERDPVFRLEFAADLRRRLPQAELHRFPLAGHLVPEDEDVATLASDWIEQLGKPPRLVTRTVVDRDAPRLWDGLVAREKDDATAVASGDGSVISFAELASSVAAIAAGLSRAGVTSGDRVALLTPEPVDFVAAAYACWVIGAQTVVVDRGLGAAGLRRALRSAEPRWLVGSRRTLGATRALRWAPTAERLDLARLRGGGGPTRPQLSAVVQRFATPDDAAAAVVYTSGSTGPAKGVLYDQRRMAAQFAAVRERYAIGPDDRLVAAFAPFALYGPALGIPVAVPECDLTRPSTLRADRLAAACAAVDATILFAAPAALQGVLASRDRLSAAGCEALARLRLVLSAGAPVRRGILEAFRELAPHAECHTPYGMTEVLSVTDIDLGTLVEVGPGRGVCVGRPFAGVDVRIEPLAPGVETGEITVSAPWQSSGYDGLWATTEHARWVDAEGTEWHRTGDVGHLDAGGRLWVEGRMAHIVWTADGPVTPVPLEVVVEAATSKHCAVAGIGPEGCQQIVVVVEQDGKPGLAPVSVDAVVREAAGPRPLAAVLTAPALPVDRRHNSKIDRTRLGGWAAAVLSGERVPRLS